MKRPSRFHPRIQTLDDRTLPAVILTNGLLEVVGTTGADLIRVTLSNPETLHVTDSGTGEDTTFAMSQVTNILVRARGGDDYVVIGPKSPWQQRSGRGPGTTPSLAAAGTTPCLAAAATTPSTAVSELTGSTAARETTPSAVVWGPTRFAAR